VLAAAAESPRSSTCELEPVPVNCSRYAVVLGLVCRGENDQDTAVVPGGGIEGDMSGLDGITN
jgi:hypothetical protein